MLAVYKVYDAVVVDHSLKNFKKVDGVMESKITSFFKQHNVAICFDWVEDGLIIKFI